MCFTYRSEIEVLQNDLKARSDQNEVFFDSTYSIFLLSLEINEFNECIIEL